MIDACRNSRDRALIGVGYEGAFRAIELATLEWQAVKFDPLGVVINTNKKTEKSRYIRLVSSVPLFAAWKRDYPYEPTGENLVFITRQNKPLEHGQPTAQSRRLPVGPVSGSGYISTSSGTAGSPTCSSSIAARQWSSRCAGAASQPKCWEIMPTSAAWMSITKYSGYMALSAPNSPLSP